MKILNLLLFVGLAAILPLQAQYYTPDKPGVSKKRGVYNWRENVFFGGNVGAAFGRNFAYAEVSPLVGYRLHERVSVGTTINYIYLRNQLGYLITFSNGTSTTAFYDYRSHIFGVSPFTRIFLLDWLFLHGEYSLYNAHLVYTKDTPPDYVYTKRGFIGFPLLGGGIVYRLGQRSGIMIMALFNPAFDRVVNRLPLYQSPLVLRIGFVF